MGMCDHDTFCPDCYKRLFEARQLGLKWQAEAEKNQVLVDCLPILIYRLKELNERETLDKWDRARAGLQEGEQGG